MTTMTKIKIQGKPQPKQRPKSNKGHFYTPPQTVAYEKLVAMTWGNRPMLQGAVAMRVTCVFKIPKSRKDLTVGQLHTQKPDATNVTKCIEDGLNGRAYVDDSQIADSRTVKVWGLDEYVEVEIEEVTDEWLHKTV